MSMTYSYFGTKDYNLTNVIFGFSEYHSLEENHAGDVFPICTSGFTYCMQTPLELGRSLRVCDIRATTTDGVLGSSENFSLNPGSICEERETFSSARKPCPLSTHNR